MHYAAYYNRVDIANLLFAKHASVDRPDKKGMNPLALAANPMNVEMVRWLPDHDATSSPFNTFAFFSTSTPSIVKGRKPTRYLPRRIERRLYSSDAFARKERKIKSCETILKLLKKNKTNGIYQQPLMATANIFPNNMIKSLTEASDDTALEKQRNPVGNEPGTTSTLMELYQGTTGITVQKHLDSSPMPFKQPVTADLTFKPVQDSVSPAASASVEPKANDQKNVKIAAAETSVNPNKPHAKKTPAAPNSAKTSKSQYWSTLIFWRTLILSSEQQTTTKSKSSNTGEKETAEPHKPADASPQAGPLLKSASHSLLSRTSEK